MNCPRCNTDVTQQDKYCPSCGLPLEAARAGGGAKKPGVKKAYEEASTQLVDVDEFKKYMADEKTKSAAPAAGPPVSPSAAGMNLASGGNLAGAKPSQTRNITPLGEGAGRSQDRITVPLQTPGNLSPAASRGDEDSIAQQPAGEQRNMMLFVAIGVIVVIIVIILGAVIAM